MGALFTFEVTGGAGALQGLAALQDAVKDLSPFWKEVFAPKYFAMVQDLFNTTGTPRDVAGRFAGQPWPMLSPTYRAWKKVNYPGKPVLVRTGELRESVRWGGESLGPGGFFEATPTHVIAGTLIPYGKYHHTGTKHMPKRQFLPPPDPAIWAPLLKNWILKAKKKA